MKFFFTFLIFLLNLNLKICAQLIYTITYKDSLTSQIQISIQFSKEKKSPVCFIMPRSIPGAYSIINYDIFIEGIYATDNTSKKSELKKSGNASPRCYSSDTGKSIIRIEYKINLKKMEERLAPSDASILRKGFTGIINYSILGWVDGTEKEPV